MAEHLAKFRSLMPSLALLFWLIEGFVGFDGAPLRVLSHFGAAKLFAAWWEYLETHVLRIFQMAILRRRCHQVSRSISEPHPTPKRSQ
jgi:hypothetical protein